MEEILCDKCCKPIDVKMEYIQITTKNHDDNLNMDLVEENLHVRCFYHEQP